MFSKTTEYALRATLYIAANSSPERKLSINEISAAIDSPRSFTAKILQRLSANERLISSSKGPGGGFYMTEKAGKQPAKIILETMDEDALLNKCVLGLSRCSDEKPCPMHKDFKVIKADIYTLFTKTSIASLAADTHKNSFLKGERR